MTFTRRAAVAGASSVAAAAVDVVIGTGGQGHTCPGAARAFGTNQHLLQPER